MAHAEQVKAESEALIDDHLVQFEALEGDVQPYIDEINNLIAQANTWQDLVSRTAIPLNEHVQWAQDYHAEYQPYYDAYSVRIQNAIDEQNLAQGFIDQMEVYQDQADAQEAIANGYFNQAKTALHNACFYLGAKQNNTFADLVDICIYGPITPDGGRITEMARGSSSTYICEETYPGEPYIPGVPGTCRVGYIKYSWQRTNTDYDNLYAQLGVFDEKITQYGTHIEEVNRLLGLAQVEYDQAIVHQNKATAWENQANNYVNGMNIYGAITASHGNVAEGFRQRYDGYLEELQQLAGVWKCVAEEDITAPAVPKGEFIDDDVWGKIVLNHQTKELHRIEADPQQEHCPDGERWARTEDGLIQAKQAELADAGAGLKRDYHQYQYGRLITPYNDLIEAANALYDGSLEADTAQYTLLLDTLGVSSITTDGIQAAEAALEADGTTYWEATSYNADGQIEAATFGNGVENVWEYDQRGRSTYIKASKDNTVLQQLGFEYDALGNLDARLDHAQDIREDFVYDAQNRLLSSTLTGNGAALYHQANLAQQTFTYDALGNLTFKSDVGHYTYGQNGAGIHALTNTALNGVNTPYQYDANGNQISGNGRTVSYTQYNKPSLITKGNNLNEFDYGPEHQLIWQKSTINSSSGAAGATTKETRYAGGNFEQEHLVGSAQTLDIHHLKMGRHTIAVLKTTPNLQSTVSTHYLHQDHLDSVVMVTDEQGEVVERNHYDAFGQRRTGVLDQTQQTRLLTGLSLQTGFAAVTDRGFTNHRQLNGPNLIHMGGRVYDPHTGRFLSADSHIQSPLNSQSYNRYSYVLNNPLSLNDPTGYFFSWLKKAFKAVIKAIKRIVKRVVAVIKKVVGYIVRHVRRVVRWVKRNFKEIVMVAVSLFVPGGAYLVAAYQSAYTRHHGGSLSDVLKAVAIQVIVQGSGIVQDVLGSTIGRVASAVGNAVGRAVSAVTNIAVAAAKRIAIKAIEKGLIQSIQNGITAKILGGSFSRAFRDSIAVSVITAGIEEYRNPTPSQAQLQAQERAAAKIAGEAYVDSGHAKYIDDYEYRDFINDPNTDLQAVIYTNPNTGHTIIGFRGTTTGRDWVANVKQAFGFRSSQYDQAVAIGNSFVTQYGRNNVMFTGHSLGGGLASAAAYATGANAMTMNAAGLHSRYRNAGFKPSINAYYSHTDILSLLQDLTPLPNSAGRRINVQMGGYHQICPISTAMGVPLSRC